MILMFQKEVAERIIANVNTSNYGRLTVLAKWKMDIKKICDIQPSSFSPKPKRNFGLLIKKIDSSKLKKKSSGLCMKVFL